MDADPWTLARRAADALVELAGGPPDEVVVLGSGWSAVADSLGITRAEVPAAELPGFAAPGAPGHRGVVRVAATGAYGDRRAVVHLGRPHLYEGLDAAAVVHPVRAAVLAGARVVVLTNAAGALRPDLPVGSLVVVADHVNLTGRSALAGAVGPPAPLPNRFADLSEVWSARLRALARQVDPTLVEGVYAGVAGPEYETPAEARTIAGLGADVVGMSTVLEAVAAAHLGAEVLGLSLVANPAAGLVPGPLGRQKVGRAIEAAGPRLAQVLNGVLERL